MAVSTNSEYSELTNLGIKFYDYTQNRRLIAQEQGFVNNNFEAIINVEFQSGAAIECLIDTGFNGTLMLPRKFIEENSIVLIRRETVVTVEQK